MRVKVRKIQIQVSVLTRSSPEQDQRKADFTVGAARVYTSEHQTTSKTR